MIGDSEPTKLKSVWDKLSKMDDEELSSVWKAMGETDGTISSKEPMEFFNAPTYGDWVEAVYSEMTHRGLKIF